MYSLKLGTRRFNYIYITFMKHGKKKYKYKYRCCYH